jgi:hypothetical protein
VVSGSTGCCDGRSMGAVPLCAFTLDILSTMRIASFVGARLSEFVQTVETDRSGLAGASGMLTDHSLAAGATDNDETDFTLVSP